MNGTELARRLKISTRKAGWLIKTGQIKAARVKRAWEIDLDSLKAFERRNKAAVDSLRKRYVELYWSGMSVEGLQKKAAAEFAERGIIWPLEGFAEQTVYNSILGK